MLNKCSSKPEFNRALIPILAIPHHHLWSSCSNLCSQKCHRFPSCPYMRQSYYYSHKGMSIDIHCLLTHLHVCKMFSLAPFLLSNVHHQQVLFGNLSSSSDELSGELSDELSGSWSLSELSRKKHKVAAHWSGWGWLCVIVRGISWVAWHSVDRIKGHMFHTVHVVYASCFL